MVRDKSGRKMSKSLGNVIDPLHMMDGVSLDDMLVGVVRQRHSLLCCVV